jgi:hypothetical protein
MKYWCSFQEKLALELRQGRLPEDWDEPLRNHVANCRSCNDLMLVTQALQHDRTETVKSARVASPGTLWWQAQVRMRNGAMERINRPVALAEKFALIILSVAFVASIAWKGGQILGWFMGPETAAHSSTQAANPALFNGWTTFFMAAGLGTVAICAGIAVYLLREKE